MSKQPRSYIQAQTATVEEEEASAVEEIERLCLLILCKILATCG